MTATLYPYPASRHSGVEWLGDIPEHWGVRRGKTILRPVDVRSKNGHEELLTVSAGRGVTPRRTLDVTMFKAESYVGHKLCWPGDLVINSLWAWAGGLGVAQHHGIVSTAYGVYRPSKSVEPRFIHELVRSRPFHWELQVRSKGVWTSRLQLTDAAFLGAPFPLPPREEQEAIVRYLDYVDRRIQRYVSVKRKLIELLVEERRAVVNQAVTRGLDPNVGLRPSGIEGLGEVPEHWEQCRLRNVVSVVTTGSRGWSSYASDTGPLFIRVANLSRGSLGLRFDDTVRLNLPETSEVTRTRIQAGDLLVSVTAYIGSVGIAPAALDEAYVSQHVARCQPRPGSSPRWLGYVLLSTVGQTHGRISTSGGTKDGLSLDDVKNYPILLPPLDEQLAIVEHIDKTFVDIDAAIARARQQIELMKEYRTRLVADVVTGKLDVRDAAARLPDEEDADDWLDGPLPADSIDDGNHASRAATEDSAIESEVTA